MKSFSVCLLRCVHPKDLNLKMIYRLAFFSFMFYCYCLFIPCKNPCLTSFLRLLRTYRLYLFLSPPSPSFFMSSLYFLQLYLEVKEFVPLEFIQLELETCIC